MKRLINRLFVLHCNFSNASIHGALVCFKCKFGMSNSMWNTFFWQQNWAWGLNSSILRSFKNFQSGYHALFTQRWPGAEVWQHSMQGLNFYLRFSYVTWLTTTFVTFRVYELKVPHQSRTPPSRIPFCQLNHWNFFNSSMSLYTT